jgi:hypothetical protein
MYPQLKEKLTVANYDVWLSNGFEACKNNEGDIGAHSVSIFDANFIVINLINNLTLIPLLVQCIFTDNGDVGNSCQNNTGEIGHDSVSST